jgi:hypothetical protein
VLKGLGVFAEDVIKLSMVQCIEAMRNTVNVTSNEPSSHQSLCMMGLTMIDKGSISYLLVFFSMYTIIVVNVVTHDLLLRTENNYMVVCAHMNEPNSALIKS